MSLSRRFSAVFALFFDPVSVYPCTRQNAKNAHFSSVRAFTRCGSVPGTQKATRPRQLERGKVAKVAKVTKVACDPKSPQSRKSLESRFLRKVAKVAKVAKVGKVVRFFRTGRKSLLRVGRVAGFESRQSRRVAKVSLFYILSTIVGVGLNIWCNNMLLLINHSVIVLCSKAISEEIELA
jgi:predicted metal-binding protein